jgi:hypothetical protein
MTAECPICGESEDWDRRKRSCQACGHYDEELAHGVVARERKQQRRRLARRRDRP